MEKFAVWVVACLLAYICLILTSINGKLDEIGFSAVDVAAVSEAKPQQLNLKQHRISLYRQTRTTAEDAASTGFVIIAALVTIFVSWHLSRIYHTHQWTKRLLRKTYAHYERAYPPAPEATPLHPDQDCVGDPPRADGRIKDSWLPEHVHQYRMSFIHPRH